MAHRSEVEHTEWLDHVEIDARGMGSVCMPSLKAQQRTGNELTKTDRVRRGRLGLALLTGKPITHTRTDARSHTHIHAYVCIHVFTAWNF